jgi:DNA repair protein RadC
MRILELCDDERPREKILSKGVGALSNSELIAVLFRTGTAEQNAIELARSLLMNNDGSLLNLASASAKVMMQTKGVGVGKAASLLAAFELGRRFMNETPKKKVVIRDSKAAFKEMMPVFRGLKHEELWVLYLAKDNSVIGREIVSKGGIDSTTFDSRIVVRKALENGATALIIFHNHPSGTPYPSANDMKATHQLKKALGLVDISLLDHIVVSDRSYYSFDDEVEHFA